MFRWSFAGYFFFGYCCVAVLGASPLISSVCCRARQNASSSLCLATHGRASPVMPRVSVAALHGAARAAERRGFAWPPALGGAARAAERRVLARAAARHAAARAAVRIIVFLCCRNQWCRGRQNAR